MFWSVKQKWRLQTPKLPYKQSNCVCHLAVLFHLHSSTSQSPCQKLSQTYPWLQTERIIFIRNCLVYAHTIHNAANYVQLLYLIASRDNVMDLANSVIHSRKSSLSFPLISRHLVVICSYTEKHPFWSIPRHTILAVNCATRWTYIIALLFCLGFCKSACEVWMWNYVTASPNYLKRFFFFKAFQGLSLTLWILLQGSEVIWWNFWL